MKEIKYILHAFLLLLASISIIICLKSIYSINEAEPKIVLTTPVEIKTTFTSKGKQLFIDKCAACHSLRTKLTGPGLCGFEERGPWSDRGNVYRWINNPAEFMKTDQYTRELSKELGVMMTGFPDLTKSDIDEIINYINNVCSPGIAKN